MQIRLEPGQPIDDFYVIETAANMVEAPVNMIVIILINQLPESIQSFIQEWINIHLVVDRNTARTFLVSYGI